MVGIQKNQIQLVKKLKKKRLSKLKINQAGKLLMQVMRKKKKNHQKTTNHPKPAQVN